MFLKSIKISNFRKFSDKNNEIAFVEAKSDAESESKVSSSTTLIVGKNNSGKTTVAKALELVHSDSEVISGNDFNYHYINNLLSQYIVNNIRNLPELNFTLTLSTNEKNSILANVKNIIPISQASNKYNNHVFDLNIKYEIKEKLEFKRIVKKIIEDNVDTDKQVLLKIFINEISDTKFKRRITNSNGVDVTLKPSKLIELKSISAANNIHDKKLLSKAFNKIIKFKYESEENSYRSIKSIVDINNEKITEDVNKTHQRTIQSVLSKIISNESIGIDLRADLTFDKLMTDIITYEHKDGDYFVPEGQFGLGYANLISIISDIIDYIERNPAGEKDSKIRLICIEEPETFMHPQMQVNFIRHIDEAVNAILGGKGNINSQIIITTHSAHILNSKIHDSGSLDYINYIYPNSTDCECVILKDENITLEEDEKNQFLFIKKHIKHQVPELFFSDAIIFVEGITEERILNFYLENDDELNKKMISVFRIDGAHGKVYSKLISQLKIPSLIITDIDFKRNDSELFRLVKVDGEIEGGNKNVKMKLYPQLDKITDKRETTNATLKYFYKDKYIIEYTDFYIKDNIKVVFQKDAVNVNISKKDTVSFYATSFEEAMILENYDNELLRTVLKNVINKTYVSILPEGDVNYFKLAQNSFKLQNILKTSKSDFANDIIYNLVMNDKKSELPKLPNYITSGLEWLKLELKNK